MRKFTAQALIAWYGGAVNESYDLLNNATNATGTFVCDYGCDYDHMFNLDTFSSFYLSADEYKV